MHHLPNKGSVSRDNATNESNTNDSSVLSQMHGMPQRDINDRVDVRTQDWNDIIHHDASRKKQRRH